MGAFIIAVILLGGGILFTVISTKCSMVIINKMDFISGKTLFYSKFQIFLAVLFLAVIILVGLLLSDLQTLLAILAIILFVYALLIGKYFLARRKRNAIKANSIKIPAKIVGMKKERDLVGNSCDTMSFYSTLRLLVEYRHPITNEMVTYTSGNVTGHPFYSLKSLKVTVYYQSDDCILIDDFDRTKKNKENLSYQLTGKVYGKVPEGFFRNA